MNKEKAFELISRCLMVALNEERGGKYSVDAVDYNTPVFGWHTALDSLGLATFLLDLEYAIEETVGREVILLTDSVGQREINPFQNVDTLCDYVVELTNG